jgi:polyhydroxyalkanoate synthesis regulator phasin
MARPAKGAAKLPDALRRAVERTFQSTVGSATLTRERAQELADDVLHRAEESAARAGRGVREAGHRPRDAAAGVGDRVRELIGDIGSGNEEVVQLREELSRLNRRIDDLERKLSASRSQSSRTGARAAGSSRTPARSGRSGAATAKPRKQASSAGASAKRKPAQRRSRKRA